MFQADDQPQQRLQGLTELYNVADDARTQHMLLRQAISYAIKANLANLLGPVIKVQATTEPLVVSSFAVSMMHCDVALCLCDVFCHPYFQFAADLWITY